MGKGSWDFTMHWYESLFRSFMLYFNIECSFNDACKINLHVIQFNFSVTIYAECHFTNSYLFMWPASHSFHSVNQTINGHAVTVSGLYILSLKKTITRWIIHLHWMYIYKICIRRDRWVLHNSCVCCCFILLSAKLLPLELMLPKMTS